YLPCWRSIEICLSLCYSSEEERAEGRRLHGRENTGEQASHKNGVDRNADAVLATMAGIGLRLGLTAQLPLAGMIQSEKTLALTPALSPRRGRSPVPREFEAVSADVRS
ncbi:MAG TPA: hypothetical protein VJW76_02140, partial [Verrucomicrobiae bacterium]|nr:hypothetical protein [Verrucomicrobiae bacterium]